MLLNRHHSDVGSWFRHHVAVVPDGDDRRLLLLGNISVRKQGETRENEGIQDFAAAVGR